MVRKVINVSWFLLISIILASCSPSEAERNAQVTAIAASIFATQTAEAPMPTSTASITPTAPPSTSTPTIPPATLSNTPAATLLTSVDESYYFRFPSEYHAVLYGSSMCLSLVSHHGPPGPCHSPSAFIDVSDPGGRNASQVADDLITELGFNIERTSITIADEEAVVLHDVPAQDSLRKVLIVHADRLYTLSFILPYPDEGNATIERFERLYTEVTGSFGFLGQE